MVMKTTYKVVGYMQIGNEHHCPSRRGWDVRNIRNNMFPPHATKLLKSDLFTMNQTKQMTTSINIHPQTPCGPSDPPALIQTDLPDLSIVFRCSSCALQPACTIFCNIFAEIKEQWCFRRFPEQGPNKG